MSENHFLPSEVEKNIEKTGAKTRPNIVGC